MTVRGVIFDLDGTLLDTLQDIAVAGNMVLETIGCSTYSVEWYRNSIGDGLRELIRRALPDRLRTEDNLAEGIRLFRQFYGEKCMVYTRPYPGIAEMLEEILRRGLKMAVLSNKPSHFTEHLIKHYFSSYNFAAIIGEQPDIPAKPDPRGAQLAAQALGACGSEVLFMGDSAVDMKTACRLGMLAVGVLWGFRSQQELEQGGAQVLLTTPSELFVKLPL